MAAAGSAAGTGVGGPMVAGMGAVGVGGRASQQHSMYHPGHGPAPHLLENEAGEAEAGCLTRPQLTRLTDHLPSLCPSSSAQTRMPAGLPALSSHSSPPRKHC